MSKVIDMNLWVIENSNVKMEMPIYEDEDFEYTHPNFHAMTGMMRPKMEYDMTNGDPHLEALLEDAKMDFENINKHAELIIESLKILYKKQEKAARKLMHIQNLKDSQ